MQRRHFLKQLGLAAALPWAGRVAFAAETPESPTATTHKILTCNVRVNSPADAKTGDSWADRKALCAEVMRAQQPDLIGVQECQRVHFDYLKAQLTDFETFALLQGNEAANPLNAIFFSRPRYELVSAGGFWLSETPHVAGSKSWDCAQPRFVNWVHLKERRSGKELRYWNTHLDHLGQAAREKSAALLVQASEVLPKTLPQILTGDFNAGAANPVIQALAAGGWTDTYSALHGPEDPGFTSHAFLGPRYGEEKLKGKRGTKIDWIWCRGPAQPKAADIIRDSRNGHYPSDHYFGSAVVAI